MKRKALGTLVLAAVVIVGTSGASGGCGSGGDGGTSAPAVGAGGEQSAPSEEHSSAEETPNEPSEPAEEGHDPCINSFGQPGKEITVKGQTLEAQVSIGPCDPEPTQYGGVLQFAYTPDSPPGQWQPLASVAVYGTSGTTKTSTGCKDGWWVVVYTASGRDGNGNDFQHPYSSIPRDIECPAKN
ncbi:hypothetical protein KGQ19_22530 [Catenulispora sp. NL8]|uniref:Uncharacterized protein n=1 Tax=Catenulispora pinistramenti TaxID=2705254 RepID=A0ABS5KUG4_9ACTN|nr:hypothetical protein [Catenulispora pinistramenti]MBS2549644.1 hypothetical protein [Catenulispora pinistramenti]